ncbi:MAG: KTSC domain-containing protein [Pseudomonadota bacterium]
MPYVTSTAIEWVDYDASRQIMLIRFRSGPVTYSYYGVPRHVYEGFLNARSKGEYFHNQIEPFYSVG